MGNPNSRAGQWELLGEDSDPLPGNPDDVRGDATHYRTIANQIDAQVARLDAVTGDDARRLRRHELAQGDALRCAGRAVVERQRHCWARRGVDGIEEVVDLQGNLRRIATRALRAWARGPHEVALAR